mmetsp:Transcript_39505/g.85260  ORF Transcript_39505/g.85260 Transcript_39505/m.85260 type:complete len:218 (-) Transcript_39505:557-1210(-)
MYFKMWSDGSSDFKTGGKGFPPAWPGFCGTCWGPAGALLGMPPAASPMSMRTGSAASPKTDSAVDATWYSDCSFLDLLRVLKYSTSISSSTQYKGLPSYRSCFTKPSLWAQNCLIAVILVSLILSVSLIFSSDAQPAQHLYCTCSLFSSWILTIFTNSSLLKFASVSAFKRLFLVSPPFFHASWIDSGTVKVPSALRLQILSKRFRAASSVTPSGSC